MVIGAAGIIISVDSIIIGVIIGTAGIIIDTGPVYANPFNSLSF